MKRMICTIIVTSLILSDWIPVYARPQYSEESKRLGREAGLQVDELEWEEIDRRQQEYRRRKGLSTSSNDELYIRNNGTTGGSVAVTDTADELHIYSNEYADQSSNYGSKNSYDECFLQAPFGKSCKVKMDNLACPKRTKLQGSPAHTRCRYESIANVLLISEIGDRGFIFSLDQPSHTF